MLFLALLPACRQLFPTLMPACRPNLPARPAADPSARVRHMVEALLLRQLGGRRLLAGNLVALPLLGQQALFAVEHVVASPGPVGRQDGDDASCSSDAAAAPAPAPASSQQSAAPPPVTAATMVRLLLPGEAAPSATSGEHQQADQDWPTLAAAAAAEALGCSPEDAGPQAARRAVMAGQASRSISFDQLGGNAKAVRAHSWGCLGAGGKLHAVWRRGPPGGWVG